MAAGQRRVVPAVGFRGAGGGGSSEIRVNVTPTMDSTRIWPGERERGGERVYGVKTKRRWPGKAGDDELRWRSSGEQSARRKAGDRGVKGRR
jgi:hypothetical protein